MSKIISCIYAITDPRDGLIHYVGKTLDFHKRAGQHGHFLRYANGAKYKTWMRDMLNNNISPTMTVLEECPIELLDFCEKSWIHQGILKGWPLTNHTKNIAGLSKLQRRYEQFKLQQLQSALRVEQL
jgi:hypothetical protein